MAPAGTGDERPKQLLVLPGNQAVFPATQETIELSSEKLREVSEHLKKTRSKMVGVIAAVPSRRGATLELYEVGTLCRLVDAEAAPSTPSGSPRREDQQDRRIRVSIQGMARFKVTKYRQEEPFRIAEVEYYDEKAELQAAAQDIQVRALTLSIFQKLLSFDQGGKSSDKSGAQRARTLASRVRALATPLAIIGFVGSKLPQLTPEERQQLLEERSTRRRLEVALELLEREFEAQQMQSSIAADMQKSREGEMKRLMAQRQAQEIKKELARLRRARAARAAEESGGREGEAEATQGPELEEEGEEEEEDEVARLADSLEKACLPQDASRIAKRELKRLKSLEPHHPEYTTTHTYLELLASLPWSVSSEDRVDLKTAKAMLDEDHKGLDKVKTRLLEFLAVQKMRGDMKGPILCLHGPPGIGKTSLGRSIARALGRKFCRLALGGVRDEAEIRGHRRTYIGSMCGSIIQAFQSAGTNNPVVLLDEVDKMTNNSTFNPMATLLEVLDPEQNSHFKDHYVNTPFDLSRALFICTANDASLIDRPLLDRMEVVDLSGYTLEEKVGITESHLLPKQRRLHALEPDPSASKSSGEPTEPKLVLTEAAMRALVTKWTSESGVRNLERLLAQICRWATLRLQGVGMEKFSLGGGGQHAEAEAVVKACGPDARGVITVDAHHLEHVLGPQLYEPDLAERLIPGVAMGLSVSSVGGQLLFIEATRMQGRGKLTITGQLGAVMTESVHTAMSLLRSRFVRSVRRSHFPPSPSDSEVLATLYSSRAPADEEVGQGVDTDRDPFRGQDVHVHFPAGGIPKDGPSAGVAILLALASVLLNAPMRSDTAVTGEVTLRGHVLPVGGIRDKVLAAHRAGIKHVLLPHANRRDVLEDIPAKTLESIEVHYVKHVDEALDWAYGQPKPGGGGRDAEHRALREQGDLPPGLSAAAAAASSMAAAARLCPWRPGAVECYLPPRSRL
mmetsp:Transcript_18373/g.53055  ORF Transcript_18373/g.53055 Transcript_18373/m.53055 type:complete len:965 (-) Transcript_18373:532-3426(-)